MNSGSIPLNNLKNILIVRLGKIGDIITTSFAFEILKDNFPNVHITLLTLNKNRDVLKYNPKIDEIIFTSKNIFFYFTLYSLKRKTFDLILDFNDNPSNTTALLFKFCKARNKISYDYENYKDLLTCKIKPLSKEKTHIIERIKFFLENIGLKINEDLAKPVLYIGNDENQNVKDYLNSFEKKNKTIAINISAGASIRYWKTSSWIQLIKMIIKDRSNINFLLLSSKEDIKIVNEINCEINEGIITQQNYSFQHFAAYIKNSDILISPDTSAIHIASAFGIPVIGLYPYSKWNVSSWRPFKTEYKVLMSKEENISSIEPNEVYNAFNDLTNSIFSKT
jgi:ADP-heptose:LPS heptosyltransferase